MVIWIIKFRSSKYSQNESNDDESQDDSQNNNEDDVEYQNGDENEYSAKDLEVEADDENDEEEVLLAKGDEFGQIPLDPIAPVIVDNQNSIPEPFIAPQFRVPCMRGFLDWKGPKITCKGRWGMSREAFDGSDATSDFEITLQTDFPTRFDIHAASPVSFYIDKSLHCKVSVVWHLLRLILYSAAGKEGSPANWREEDCLDLSNQFILIIIILQHIWRRAKQVRQVHNPRHILPRRRIRWIVPILRPKTDSRQEFK